MEGRSGMQVGPPYSTYTNLVRSASQECLPRPSHPGQVPSRSCNYGNKGKSSFRHNLTNSTGNLTNLGQAHSTNFSSTSNLNFPTPTKSILGAPPTQGTSNTSFNPANQESIMPPRQGLSYTAEGGLQTSGYRNRLDTSSSTQGVQGNPSREVQGKFKLKPYAKRTYKDNPEH